MQPTMSPAPHGLTYATLITALRLTMSIRQARSIAAQYRTEDGANDTYIRHTIPLPYIDGRYLIRYCPTDRLYYAFPMIGRGDIELSPPQLATRYRDSRYAAAVLRRIASIVLLSIATFSALASPAIAASPHSRDVTKHRSDMGKRHAAPHSQPPTIHRQHTSHSTHNSHK